MHWRCCLRAEECFWRKFCPWDWRNLDIAFFMLDWTILKHTWWFVKKIESNVLRIIFFHAINAQCRLYCMKFLTVLHWYEFWCTGIHSPRFCKWLWLLNWSKWILVMDIPPKILLLLTIFLSIDHSSRCKLDVYIITYTKEKPSWTNWYLFAKLTRNGSQKSEQHLSESVHY